MIKELRLQNYRGFVQHTIPFKKLNVIVGANNAGKSTIVEALGIISLVTNRYKNLAYKKSPEWLLIEGNVYGVSPSMKHAEISFDSICNQYKDEFPAVISATFGDGSEVMVYLNKKGDIHAVIKVENGKILSSKRDAGKIELPNINILPQVGPVQKDEVILDPDYVKSAVGSSLSPLHFRNQLNIFESYFPSFQKLVEQTWPGVMVQQLLKESNFPKTPLFLQIRNENFAAEVSAMGHGLQMWLQVIWFLTLFGNSNIIILDEPDVYMHADLQKRLIRLIKDRFPQVIITTHSIEIMSEVEPEEILVIDKISEKSTFAIKIPAVQRVVESIGSIHNIHLARLWKAKKFILVEGKDMDYFKIIQNKLFPNSINPIDSIPYMAIGGWCGWNLAIGSSMFLKNAFNEKLIVYCILDSDYHLESEINERLKKAQNKEIELHIWRKKEIENYFIVPEAFQRIINKRNQINSSPTVDEIKNQLSEIFLSLKENTTDCIANEILLRNKKNGLQDANRKARLSVYTILNKEGSISSIVSGKEVISKMAIWAQNKYKVSFSAAALLQELNKQEIDNEIVSVVNSIEFGEKFIK